MILDADKIKRWREERFWSQEHLAQIAGIAPRTIQRIENGEKASRESVMALAAAFNVDVNALTHDPARIDQDTAREKLDKARAALRLSFFIVLASWAFIMIVFVGVSMSDGPGGNNMLIPGIWVTVAAAGQGLAWAIAELVARFGAPAKT